MKYFFASHSESRILSSFFQNRGMNHDTYQLVSTCKHQFILKILWFIVFHYFAISFLFCIVTGFQKRGVLVKLLQSTRIADQNERLCFYNTSLHLRLKSCVILLTKMLMFSSFYQYILMELLAIQHKIDEYFYTKNNTQIELALIFNGS